MRIPIYFFPTSSIVLESFVLPDPFPTGKTYFSRVLSIVLGRINTFLLKLLFVGKKFNSALLDLFQLT